MTQENQPYWILSSSGNPNAMLLYSLPEPDPDELIGWIDGELFSTPPKQPIIARIQPGYEDSDPPIFEETPQIMSIEFMEALKAVGVDNIDYYDVQVKSEDEKVNLPGYKAYNIVGVVSATDITKSEFSSDNPSLEIDASIRSLAIDKDKTKGLLLFRLAESIDTIIIHDTVKRSLEKHGFKGVEFIPPVEHLS